MKVITIDEIPSNFLDHLKEATSGPIVVTEMGQPIAAINFIIDPEELERVLLANHPIFQQILADADVRLEQGKGLKHDDFWELAKTTYPQ